MAENFKIALVGNPNTGKSSLFNALTGLNQKIANFPGVTVEKSTGYFMLKDGRRAEITDLPGAYSLFPKSIDEAIPFEVLLDEKNPHHPDLVVYIADSSNLKRNLVMLTQVLDLGFPTVLALNMSDQAEAMGITIDAKALGEKLGCAVVPMNARAGKGIPDLLGKIAELNMPSTISFLSEESATLSKQILPDSSKKKIYSNLLNIHNKKLKSGGETTWQNLALKAKNDFGFDSGTHQRNDLLHRNKALLEILKNCVKVNEDTSFKKRQAKLDYWFTHKIWGYVIFFASLFLIFQALFVWAKYPMDLIEASFSYLSQKTSDLLPDGVLNDLISNGVLAGLSGVVVFIPQIAFLFFFISIMEETGYLARVAFLMDKVMRQFGMNGKSVVPLMSGTACAVPAIMAARSIENRRSRLITILVTPLMSCSARLPVYILLISIIIPSTAHYGMFNLQGIVLMGLYVVGFLSALFGGLIFSTVIKTTTKQYFFLELPVYRVPNWKSVGINVWKKVKSFLGSAGKIIIAISIILWFLASYGPSGKFDAIHKKYELMAKEKSIPIDSFKHEMSSEKLENSYAGIVGRVIEPSIRPLGFDWKIGIALVTSFAAREVFVGTMATIYGLEGDNPNFSQIKKAMNEEKDANGVLVYTFATVISLLFFYVFALQCMSTIAVTYKETLSWKWTLFQLVFMTGLAYLVSFVLFQVLK